MAAEDDGFASLEGLEAKTAVKGFSLIRAAYYIAIGVVAIWIAKKLFKR